MQLASLTKHDLTGAILQAGVQSYFALNDTQDYIAAKQSSVVAHRQLAFGTFSTNLKPNQRYGLTLGAKLSGMLMDIDQLRRAGVDKDNDLNKTIAFNAAQGPRQSANEHLVPEALFDDPSTTAKEVQGVSAVKALSIASQQGQKIFTINQTNIAQVLPLLHHKAAVIEDVQNAVSTGKIVTISERSISTNGWTGTGYVIVDPKTGAGAYLIGGGMDGGAVLFAANILVFSLSLFFIGSAILAGGVGIIGLIFTLVSLAVLIKVYLEFLALGKKLSDMNDTTAATKIFNTYTIVNVFVSLGSIGLGKVLAGEKGAEMFTAIAYDLSFYLFDKATDF